MAKNCARLPDEAYAEYYEDFIRHTMGLSPRVPTRGAGHGDRGSSGRGGRVQPHCPHPPVPACTGAGVSHWAEVFDAVAGGDAAYGVLPFENSHAGDVSEVLDLCYATGISACATYTTCPSARICWAFRARICRT